MNNTQPQSSRILKSITLMVTNVFFLINTQMYLEGVETMKTFVFKFDLILFLKAAGSGEERHLAFQHLFYARNHIFSSNTPNLIK